MKEKNKIKKILLFKIGAIGDVLMTTPLIRQIRKEFPKAKIVYYVGKYSVAAIENNKNIDKIEVFDQNLFFKKNIFKAVQLRNKIKKEKFDMAFVLDKHWIFGLFIKLCRIPIRIGLNRDNKPYLTNYMIYRKAQHEIIYYLSLLESIGIMPSANTDLDVYLSKKDISWADKFFKDNKLTGKTIGMLIGGGGENPGEAGAIRRFPVEKYLALIQNLAKDHKILLIGGPGDKELTESVVGLLKNKNVVSSAGKTTIKQAIALMKKCNVMITHDSGPMHMAAAVNKKIISLFGPTNPVRKAPLHAESIAIWKDQDIYEEDYELYGKLPDSKNKDKWMKRISVEEIEDAVKKLI